VEEICSKVCYLVNWNQSKGIALLLSVQLFVDLSQIVKLLYALTEGN